MRLLTHELMASQVTLSRELAEPLNYGLNKKVVIKVKVAAIALSTSNKRLFSDGLCKKRSG